eukprot:scaffold412_cov388-Prasinococcus_capsulatus_cf.AAC.21
MTAFHAFGEGVTKGGPSPNWKGKHNFPHGHTLNLISTIKPRSGERRPGWGGSRPGLGARRRRSSHPPRLMMLCVLDDEAPHPPAGIAHAAAHPPLGAGGIGAAVQRPRSVAARQRGGCGKLWGRARTRGRLHAKAAGAVEVVRGREAPLRRVASAQDEWAAAETGALRSNGSRRATRQGPAVAR